ncbi:hypothetical protein QQ008_13510 [Fulvivirgaceae bacterium BMA10]|uniref:Uncharacterized protein n=1 Tax=Splendidivirga corallicola TaxID=3051826 RepID=A0ABT8KRY9_9BACT|nr:hypothetical protein [Fulvivirgaceae bacterium BMA10]
MKKKFSITIILLLLVLVEAFSNGMFYSTAKSGVLITEPFAKAYCNITHENLFIDLRPLANNGDAIIFAEYELYVEKPVDSLLFLFVAASIISDGIIIELDGNPLNIQIDRSGKLLSQLRETTVITPWGEPDGYGKKPEYFKEEYVFCKMDLIEKRQHKLTIKYNARTTETFLYQNESKTVVQTLSYALYPAKHWKSFGGLDLEIRYPDGWELKTNLPLNLSKETINEFYTEIPDDFLHIHIRFPENKASLYLNLYESIFVIALLAICYMLIGKILKKKSIWYRAFWLFLLALATTVGYMFLFLYKETFFRKFVTDEIVFPNDRAYLIFASPILLAIVFILLIFLTFVRRTIQLRIYRRE